MARNQSKSERLNRRSSSELQQLRRVPIRRLGTALTLGAVGAGIGISRAMSSGAAPHGIVPEATVANSLVADEAALAGSEWDLPNIDHERVDYWVQRFSTDKREDFARFLERSGRYVPMIQQKLEERGMPQDLIFLAMIESGFNPEAYSAADASGLWQFIEETGERYGLEVNRAVDERNDPIKATDAALTYLQEMHDRFDSWYLAAASYNTGENRVGRIMREETGSEKGTEQSYYQIWDRLPKETRDYVPLMIAAARISKDPARYGFAQVQRDAPLRYDEVVVDPATPLDAVAEAAGITVDVLRDLNPQLKLDRTRNDQRSVIRVPEGKRTAFLVNWPKLRKDRTLALGEYRVRAPESLLALAREN
jgi:membrane-bound lytic murein transglycosylase D